MKTRILFASLAGLAVMLGLAIRGTLQLRAAQAALAEIAPARDRLQDTISTLELRLHAAKKHLEELPPSPAEASTGTTLSTETAALSRPVENKSPAPAKRLSSQTLVANDPEQLAIYLKNRRAGLDWDYGSLFKAVRFSPEQIEKFKDLEIWLEARGMDLNAAIELQGLRPESAEYKKLWAENNKIRGDKKKELLGDLMESYMEYFWTQSVRGQASELAWTGVLSGEAITSDQIERATDVLSANSKRRGAPGDKKHGVEWNTVNWAAASPQLKSILTPSQIETLGGILERNRIQQQLNDRTNQLTAQFRKITPAK